VCRRVAPIPSFFQPHVIVGELRLHVELLAEAFRQLGREHTCNRIDRAARCEWRDHLHRPIGISGLLREARTGDQKRSKTERERLHLGSSSSPPRDHSILRVFGERRSEFDS
jgi:hypothetical protein